MPRSFELTCAPALARVLAGGSQPQAGLRQLDVALARDLGHRLFTVLALDWTRGLSVRHYSNAPLAYPPGGAKPSCPVASSMPASSRRASRTSAPTPTPSAPPFPTTS